MKYKIKTKNIVLISLLFYYFMNCSTKDECDDSKKKLGIKKDNICVLIDILAYNKISPQNGKDKSREQIASDSFYNDLRLLGLGICTHVSKPSDRKCKYTF